MHFRFRITKLDVLMKKEYLAESVFFVFALYSHIHNTRGVIISISIIAQGRVVRKPISVNPGLKVNREFNFFCIKVFLLFMFCED